MSAGDPNKDPSERLITMNANNTIELEANSLSSLDNTEHNRNNSNCGKWTLVGKKDCQGQTKWGFVRVYCKKWSCPCCGPVKAAKLRKAIISNAEEKKMNRLMTLTLNPKICSADESVEHIKLCWNKLRTYLKRKFGKSVSFITILEFHKSGYAHMHILVDKYIEQKWLSETWQALGGGKIVDIKYVDIHRIAHYLSKYLTKQTFLKNYGKNRRYTTSRNMSLFKKKVAETVWQSWRVLKERIDLLLRLAGLDSYAIQSDYDKNIRYFEIDFDLIKEFPRLEDSLLL